MNFYNDSVSQIEKEYPPKIVVKLCKLIGLSVSKVFWRIKFSGLENIPRDLESGLIIAANHQTYFDPVWICLKVDRKFRFMAWDNAFRWFLIGPMIKYLGAFPVGLDRVGFVKASRKAKECLRDGATLIIFPEAEREFSDGKLLPFKSGAVRLALDAKVPILPVTIRGGNRIWAQDAKYPGFGKVEIIYHPLIFPSSYSKGDELRNCAAELNNELISTISDGIRPENQ